MSRSVLPRTAAPRRDSPPCRSPRAAPHTTLTQLRCACGSWASYCPRCQSTSVSSRIVTALCVRVKFELHRHIINIILA